MPESADPLINRINVPVHPSTVEALQRLMVREGCQLYEAVARLIALGDVVASAIDVDGATVQIVDLDGAVHRVLGFRL